MRVELITTGSELMLGFTINTHLSYIGRKLASIGLRLERQTTVADARDEMRAAITAALARSDVIIITGGLGPTSDDFTRDIVAELLGRKLVRDETVAAQIEERFRKRGIRKPESVNVQSLVPVGAQVLPNRNGTAPGLVIDVSGVAAAVPAAGIATDAAGTAAATPGRLIIMLPGPPRELKPMFEEYVLPVLQRKYGAQARFECRQFRVVGLPESIVEEKVAPVLAGLKELELGYSAKMGEVEVRIITPTRELADEAERRIHEALGDNIYGAGDDRLEETLVKMLIAARRTIAVAESCTGGLIANRLTNVSGASEVFLNGWVTYSNESKVRELGVSETALQRHGAVSEEVAREMAEGARQRSGADFAVSTTGIAGPTGGTPDKPVGLIYIGFSKAGQTAVQRHVLTFDRETFKFFASQYALDIVRRELLHSGDGAVGHRALPVTTNSKVAEQTKPGLSVGRAGSSAPPRRKILNHDLPLGVRSEEAVFFLTVCSRPRGRNQLCLPAVAPQLLKSIEFRHRRGDWFVRLALLMPDHLHMIVLCTAEESLAECVREWKKYAARQFKIVWQRDFFEHRLRRDESLRQKTDYILQNPVRAGLTERAENWPYVWFPRDTATKRRGGPPRPTSDIK